MFHMHLIYNYDTVDEFVRTVCYDSRFVYYDWSFW